MQKFIIQNYTNILFVIVLSLIILVIDMVIPLGVAVAVPYIAPIFISLWVKNKSYILTVSVTTTFFALLGFILSPPGGILWMVVTNRLLAILAIWVTAIMGLSWIKSQEALIVARINSAKLREINIELETGITNIKETEKERLKLQKLESIGLLAGGIAHDFNNLLTAILGNISMVKNSTDNNSKTHKLLDGAEKAAKQAAQLTHQLVTFSKADSSIREAVFLDKLITESASFALSGSDIKLELSFTKNIAQVKADKGQISQILNNLIINAKQSMQESGTIKIGLTEFDVSYNDNLPLTHGNYIMISIQDEGAGIPDEILPRIFDPYFTTKEEGTGLGLATTYSIIKSHQGHIGITTIIDEGTTFNIYLPSSKGLVTEDATKEDAIKTGWSKVLIMDDEESIRTITKTILGELGYTVETTENGEQAIELYADRYKSGKTFDAVILDLTIKGGMGGEETIKKLLEINPDVKAIVSSGYFRNEIMSQYKHYGFIDTLPKPYTASQLSAVLYKTLHD